MATRWQLEHEGRRIEVEPENPWSGYVLRLFVDGEQVREVKRDGRRITVESDGIAVTAWLSRWGASIQRAELVAGEGAQPIPLAPEAGTRAARREEWGRRHPGLYSARHAAAGVGEVLIGVVVLALLVPLLLRLLPDVSIDTPSIDLPLPDVDLPSIDLPLPQIDLTMPGWVRAIADTTKYWVPILIGIGFALREYDRRKRQAGGGEDADGDEPDDGDAVSPDDGTPADSVRRAAPR